MAAREMVPVSDGVRNISSFVTRRLNRLQGELKGQENLTLQCPDCEQMTLVVVPGGGFCHFCGASWSSDESIACDYLEARDETEELIQLCPQCDCYALVESVVFADDPNAADSLYCFGCTVRYTAGELISCAGCSRLWPIEADDDGGAGTLCPECRDQTQPESVE
ncbi:hypothetical protein [Streptomyces lasiicapitis]|uniref:hypothetical protein n=1 Tax=Streptomyces lasiicapitis TaxID=1923961 RepID=UPI0036AECDDC